MTVDLAPDVLRIRATDGTLLGEWPYDKLEAVPAPEGVDDGEKSDDQLSIEQGRLRGVKGGGESGKSSKSAKAPAKKSGTQRRRKAS